MTRPPSPSDVTLCLACLPTPPARHRSWCPFGCDDCARSRLHLRLSYGDASSCYLLARRIRLAWRHLHWVTAPARVVRAGVIVGAR